MQSKPAPNVLRVTKKQPAPGLLAQIYMRRQIRLRGLLTEEASDRWLKQRNKRVDPGKTKRPAEPIWETVAAEDSPFHMKGMPQKDAQRIEKNARMIEAKRLPATFIAARLTEREREPLFEASAQMRLGGYASEHQVDVAFAAIHEECPWLGRATEILWKQARLTASRGDSFRVGPIILLGPPGLGKSTLARAIGRHFSVPTIEVDAGATSGVFDLQGTDQRWGSSAPGRVMMKFLQDKIANPIVVIDEIDAGSRMVSSTKGGQPGLFKALMGMVEPTTAAQWNCPYFQIPVDLRHVSWIMTANRIDGVEQALLDRCRVIELDGLTVQQLTAYAQVECLRRMDDQLIGELISEQVEARARRGEVLSLRHVSRMIDRAEAVLSEPIRH